MMSIDRIRAVRRHHKAFAPVLTECDHCGKRRRTVVIEVSLPDGPRNIGAHLCGHCLANAVRELDRALQTLLRERGE